MIKETIFWIVTTVLAAVIGVYVDHLLDLKDDEIIRLSSIINSLEKQANNNSSQLSSIGNEVQGVSEGIAALSKTASERKIQAINQYMAYIEKISIVKEWQSHTNLPVVSIGRYDGYAQKVNSELVLQSMKSTCELYTYHLWFADEAAYGMPKQALIEMAKFFHLIEQKCELVLKNIKRIESNAWYSNFAFYLSGQVVITYEEIETRYDAILYSAKKILLVMAKEKRRAQ